MRVLAAVAVGALLPACLLKPDPPGGGNAKKFDELTLGARHACARSDTNVYCWGDNRRGQVGLSGLGEQVLRATRLDGAWSSISAGADHTCGIRDGQLLCWGENADGQVTGAAGGHVTEPMPVAIPAGATPTFARVEAGGRHSCALTVDHQLWCWGNAKQVGVQSDAAIQIGTRTDWADLAAGTKHTCGIAGDTVLCWGENDRGACGPGDPLVMMPTPVAVVGADGLHPLRVYAGEDASCAIFGEANANKGSLWCWGFNNDQILQPGGVPVVVPTQIPGDKWSDVSLSTGRMCGIDDGMQFCWGYSDAGGLGDGLWVSSKSVDDRVMIGPANDVELGVPTADDRTTHFGCMRQDKVTSCWGDAPNGEIALDVRALQPIPVEVPKADGLDWEDVWTGSGHTCARNANKFYCWGNNAHGQVDAQSTRGGDTHCIAGQPCDYLDPLAIAEISTAGQVDAVAGDGYTCARTGTSVYCWGSDAGGKLGSTMPSGPTSRKLPGTWRALFGGPEGTCGLDGTSLLCWGHVAQDDLVSLTAVPIANATTGGLADSFACVTDISAQRWCWGDRSRGQLGDGSTMGQVDNPFLIQGNVVEVAAAGRHACALDTNNFVQCWGAHDQDATGQSDDVPQPTAVMTDTEPLSNCRHIVAGDLFSCAACDATVRCWGDNIYEELGRLEPGRSSQLALPVMLGPGVWKVAAGLDHACALTPGNGRLFCWGRDLHGQLGDKGHGVNFPTPIVAPAL